MDIAIRGIPDIATNWELTKLLATVIHSDEFHPTHDVERPERQLLLNFQVKVNINEKLGGYRNDTTGTLTLPTYEIGKKFLDWVDERPIRMPVEDGKPHKLRFRPRGHPYEDLALTLQRTPYVDPDREAEHAEILRKLDHRLRVDTVQFGVYYHTQYRPTGPLPSRGFSVEWEHDYVTDAQSAWLTFEYDHKLIRIRVSIHSLSCCSLIIYISRRGTKRETIKPSISTSTFLLSIRLVEDTTENHVSVNCIHGKSSQHIKIYVSTP